MAMSGSSETRIRVDPSLPAAAGVYTAAEQTEGLALCGAADPQGLFPVTRVTSLFKADILRS